jgi:hypothetical protein
MKHLLTLLLFISTSVMADLKPLSSNTEESDAMFIYRTQRCAAFFLAAEWLFEISNKTDIAKSMKKKGIILGNLAYEVAKSKTDTAKITPESNAEGVMRIYNLYINDMQSARASTGNYTDGVVGSDTPFCNSAYDEIASHLNL